MSAQRQSGSISDLVNLLRCPPTEASKVIVRIGFGRRGIATATLFQDMLKTPPVLSTGGIIALGKPAKIDTDRCSQVPAFLMSL